jgi:hypothetical protein
MDVSDVIEEAVRRDLGVDTLERLWRGNAMAEDESLRLTVEAQHTTRAPGG